ncbi:hypothetical protein [Phenylobacterium sp.]|uniref:hypothetical protein n=1 Tax=Phenylobacterium sp. TaxID=1871053 RepID=UPI0025EE2C2E|nr:hypothetical protein [Phenylobacterium sp.]
MTTDSERGAGPSRRELFAGAGVGVGAISLGVSNVAAQTAEWRTGDVAHLLPTVSHDEILLKASLTRPARRSLTLRVDGRQIPGLRSDIAGRYWRFRASRLTPGRVHRLQLFEGGDALCDPWPLATLEAPDSRPDHFRLVSFTCAGGDPDMSPPGAPEVFRPMAVRRRLLARAMSFQPQAIIANGDHIYWDQRTWLESRNPRVAASTKARYAKFGMFDREQPLLGTVNEDIIRRIGEAQIAALYGVSLRSTPSYFVGDDHDYFENDEAEERFVTFPPDHFSAEAKRAVQTLFYPEFLPEATRPLGISGARSDGLSESFGSLRVGRLFEALIYDCGGHLTLKGPAAGLVPPEVEAWLLARTQAQDTAQLLHVPSHPPGWSAGKWREWYPDIVVNSGAARVTADGSQVTDFNAASGEGRLSVERPKYMWQEGWNRQHQRLMRALSAQATRPAAVISGDLHAVGGIRIERSGDLDLSANPVNVILAGTLGSSTSSWPSAVRGSAPQKPSSLTTSPLAPVSERNGFTVIDVEPDRMQFRLFAWREPQPVEAIDSLQPFATFDLAR